MPVSLDGVKKELRARIETQKYLRGSASYTLTRNYDADYAAEKANYQRFKTDYKAALQRVDTSNKLANRPSIILKGLDGLSGLLFDGAGKVFSVFNHFVLECINIGGEGAKPLQSLSKQVVKGTSKVGKGITHGTFVTLIKGARTLKTRLFKRGDVATTYREMITAKNAMNSAERMARLEIKAMIP